MRVITQIGEASAMIGGEEYLVRPSFGALAELGDPETLDHHIKLICEGYAAWVEFGVMPNYEALSACANILECCSDIPPEFMGETKLVGGKIKWKQGIPVHELIIMGHHCVKWGVAGDSKYKNKPKKQTEKELFDPADFVSVLIDEFHMNKSDAWDCTMTEFQRLCEQRQNKAWAGKPKPPTKESAMRSFQLADEAIKRARELNIQPTGGGKKWRKT